MWITLTSNPFECDDRMQWIKIGEQQGWLTFDDPNSRTIFWPRANTPTCANYRTHWQYHTLPGDRSCKDFYFWSFKFTTKDLW